jgi:hypothetical protein
MTKGDRKPLFDIERLRIGGGLVFAATLTDGTWPRADRIEGFATEGEAGRWIRNESVAWLHSRKAI